MSLLLGEEKPFLLAFYTLSCRIRVVDKKTCTQCHQDKFLGEFGVRKGASDGLNYVCKTCTNQRGRERYRQRKGGPVRDMPRKPLPEQATKAGWALRKDIDRLERIYGDDRYRGHRAQITAILGEHLKYAFQALGELLDEGSRS